MTDSDLRPDRALVAFQAAAFEALCTRALQAADMHKSLVVGSAEDLRILTRAVLTINRDIAQITLDAAVSRDPVALATLVPRAIQLGIDGGMARLAVSLDRSWSIGLTVLSAWSHCSGDKTERA